MFPPDQKSAKKGFTLTETVVGAAIFLIVAASIYGSYASLFHFINDSQYKELAVDLAEEQMEIIRNMPYSDVGVVNSIPSGNIPYEQSITRGGVEFLVTTIVRNIDLAADGTAGGTPNDTNPADNKLISITVSCVGCGTDKELTVTGQVAPLSLESIGNTGSLFINVHNALGKSIQGSDITAVNVKSTTTVTIHDVTNSSGLLALVGVPPGANAYRIIATKDGYSTDRTYPIGGTGNPNPTNADANVSTGQVTSVDLFIDELADLSISSVSPTCEMVPGFHFNMIGSKTIGTDVPKFSQSLNTDSSGTWASSSIEWDSAYTITPTDTAYDLAGVNPLSPFALNPAADMDLQLIVVPKTSNSLMVTVTDSTTGLPLSGAAVTLTGTGYSATKVTGQGFVNQTDWSGGEGQALFSETNKYASDDDNVDVTTVPGDIRLRNAFGAYNPSGYLESSTFDTGTTSNFYNFIWSPTNNTASTSVKFQFATSASSTPDSGWNFIGPDGTSASYYLSSGSSFDSALNGNQYARYRAYLSSATTTATPDVSDIGFTYTSACIPPGQVIFQGLELGTYTLSITKTGYDAISSDNVSVVSPWQSIDEPLSQTQ